MGISKSEFIKLLGNYYVEWLENENVLMQIIDYFNATLDAQNVKIEDVKVKVRCRKCSFFI